MAQKKLVKKELKKEWNPDNYGSNLFVVGVTDSISKDKFITVYADYYNINEHGEIVFVTILNEVGDEAFNLALAQGSWKYVYATPKGETFPISVETWKDISGVPIVEERKRIAEELRIQEEEEERKRLEEEELMKELEKEENDPVKELEKQIS